MERSTPPKSSLAAAAEEATDQEVDQTATNDNQSPSTSTLPQTTELVVGDETPLNAKWTLWFDNPRLAPAGSDWKENLKTIGTFHTVESFWQIFNNCKPASQISVGSNYSVFRNGVEPSWEDPSNRNGGKFVLTMSKSESKNGKCDEYWLFSVLAIVGETMDQSGDQVNGAVVSIRKSQDRVALWLKSSDKKVCVSIGERWKKALTLETIMKYQMHKDAAASGRSFRNEVQFEA